MINERPFYNFTKAMDLKYDDTVEAIHDLVTFCIATDNHNLWDKIYYMIREEVQKVIDNDEYSEKIGVLAQFRNDEWLEMYLNKVV